MLKIIKNNNLETHKYQFIANDLTLKVGDKIILEKFNINIKFSNILILKGKVGSGKSSILKMIGNIIKPTNGIYHLKNLNTNNDIDALYIHSQPELNFITGYIKDELILAGINDFKPFDQYINKTVYELNGGALKKLSLLMALSYGNGRVILADEPLDMLDDIEAENLTKQIYEYSNKSPFIIATHDDLFDNIADIIISF